MSPITQAARFSPVTKQAQSKLTELGFDPGASDGILGRHTKAALKAFQVKQGLPATGTLDRATLAQLDIGGSPGLVKDWRSVPTQDELDKLVAYTDYRPDAPAANLDLPGAAILAAMNSSADTYGSRTVGQPKHTDAGYKYLTDCLMTDLAPTHWSDITIHYYCQMSLPRRCYTFAIAGQAPAPAKLARLSAYHDCATGAAWTLPQLSADFAFVLKTQPQVFQYVMLGQTNAFNHEQEQAIINAFYGVKDPADREECKSKRPLRTEDPTDGTHCLANKTMKLAYPVNPYSH
jgi:Putative peptidoglycan binding domain